MPVHRSHLARLSSSPNVLMWLVLLLALLGQIPLLLNPGYFSHDELQWAAAADVAAGAPLPWFPWTAVDAYQYRPLTFNLWLWLSHRLFDDPQGFHAVCVLWGSVNAMLLAVLGRRLGVAPLPAAAAALVFALGPFAALVHGWVGTLGDLIWSSCALGIGLLATARVRIGWVVAGTAVLTASALLAKEAAMAIPAMLAVAWWFDRRRRVWGLTMVSSAVVAAVYLLLRLEALLQPVAQGPQYALSLAHPPLRWLEYQLFAPLLHVPETFATFPQGGRIGLAIAAVLWLGGLFALSRGGWRLLALALVGGIAALLPVLPLGASWNHYGYAWAAWTAMCFAAAWPAMPRSSRALVVLTAVLALAHGAMVMRLIHRVGTIQAVFSPALADAVAAAPAHPVRLQVAPDASAWIFQRLTHEIPGYRGVPIGARVMLVAAGMPADASADYRIEADGRLVPLR